MFDHVWWKALFADCQASDDGFTKRAHIASNNQGFVVEEESNSQHCMFRLTDRDNLKFKIYGMISDISDGAPCAQTICNEFLSYVVDDGTQTISAELNSLGESRNLMDYKLLVEQRVRNWFQSIDCKYFNSIDEDFAALYRQTELTLGEMTPENEWKLEEMKGKVSGGASAAFAFVICDRLFVANCGNVRALLISQDRESNSASAETLSQLHQTENHAERQRLMSLGVNEDQISFIRTPTRCFGNFFMKGGYQDDPRFSLASSEPCTVNPYVSGGFKVDASHRFLVLASESVFKVILQAGINDSEVNDYLVEKIATAYGGQYSNCDVSQKVLDEICGDHSAYQLQRLSLDPVARRDSMALVCVCLHEGYQQQLVLNRILDAPVIPTSTKRDNSQMVASYVDFSSFVSHPKRDIVTLKVDQIFEELRSKRRLKKIEEDDNNF